MKKITTTFIILLFVVSLLGSVSAEVLDGGAEPLLFSITGCDSPYCSSLSPDYYLKKCGDTTYKYYCGDGNTCENGLCVEKGNVCSEGYVRDYYCSQLSNAKLRQYQNADCSITTYKTNCLSTQLCEGGHCITQPSEPTCNEGYTGDYYCSGLSNARLRKFQKEDCSIVTYKYNCDIDERCESGICNKITSCEDKWLGDYYCSQLSNAKLRQRQELIDGVCQTNTQKVNCGSNEICQAGQCIQTDEPDVDCPTKWISEYYCSSLSNAKLRQRQELIDGVCQINTGKWACDATESCFEGDCKTRKTCSNNDDCEEHQKCETGKCINIPCSDIPESPCEKAEWQPYPTCEWNTGSCPNPSLLEIPSTCAVDSTESPLLKKGTIWECKSDYCNIKSYTRNHLAFGNKFIDDDELPITLGYKDVVECRTPLFGTEAMVTCVFSVDLYKCVDSKIKPETDICKYTDWLDSIIGEDTVKSCGTRLGILIGIVVFFFLIIPRGK